MLVYLQTFFITGVGKIDPLGCLLILLVALVASLGKACHFLKICSKRNKFKVDGLLAYVHMACWLN